MFDHWRYALNNIAEVKKIIKCGSKFDPKMTRKLIANTHQTPA